MSRIFPNLLTYPCTIARAVVPVPTSDTLLLSLPLELLSLLVTYLPVPDSLQFTNSSTLLRSLRTKHHSANIKLYLRSRRVDQENLSSSPSPDRVSVGSPLADRNNSPSPTSIFRTPFRTPRRTTSSSSTNSVSSFTSSSFVSPPEPMKQTRSVVVVATTAEFKTPRSSTEKRSKRRLSRL